MTQLVDQLLDALGVGAADPRLLQMHDMATVGTGEQARRARRQQCITYAVLREALRRIDDGFGDDVPYILLKGEPLGNLLFGRRFLRATGDIDLLVLPGDLEEARGRLARLGYRRDRDEPPRLWAHNQQAWRHDNHDVVVELHWSTSVPGVPQLPLAKLFQSRQSYRFDRELCVDVLAPGWLLLHLALHFHHHLGFAKGLVDIAGWCDRFGAVADQRTLFDRAHRHGLAGLLQWPLHTLAMLTDQSPPMLSDDIDSAVRSWATISARSMRNCLAEPPSTALRATLTTVMPHVGPWRTVPLLGATMLILDGWPQKLRGFLSRTFLGPHSLGRQLHRLKRSVRR